MRMGRLMRRGSKGSFHLRAGEGGVEVYIIVWVWFNGVGEKICMFLSMQTEGYRCNNKESWNIPRNIAILI